MHRVFVCVLLLSTVASAQDSPSFEVASIRPSSEQVAQVSAGVRVAGSQVRMTAMSVKEFIVIAYGAKPQQIVGPEWLGQSRFDVAATIPADASAEQFPQMLRALLAERFQMTMHRETKEFPVYVLGVARGGPKFELSKAPAPVADNAAEKTPAVNVTANGSSAGTAIDLGRGSSFAFGNNRFEAKKMTMNSLAEVLTRFVDRPVLDQTGLTGEYDVVLDIAPEDYMPLIIRSGVNAGVSLPPQALRLLDGANADPLSGPLRDVGLTLDSKRAPLETIVVDSISKTPTEN